MEIMTYNAFKRYPEAYNFISELIQLGVDRSAIMTNDIESCPSFKVYITIPYGYSNGGKQKVYKRLSKRDAQNASTWYKQNAVR